CEQCGEEFEPGLLSGTPEGRPTCASCLIAWNWGGEDSYRPFIEAAGFKILEALGGIPPSFKVERAGLGKVFCVKASRIKDVDAARLAEVREEIRGLAKLEHETITSIYDVLEAENVLLLVLSFEAGESLEKMIKRRGPLGARPAVE